MKRIPRIGWCRGGKLGGMLGAVAGVFMLSMPISSLAETATDEVRGTLDKIHTIFQDPNLRSEARKRDRQIQLRQALGRRFDYTEMAKRALGSHWQEGKPRQQDEFVKLFAELVEETYLDQIDPYLGQKIVYLRESRDGDFSEVATKIISAKGDEFAINYRLRSYKGDWKIYDMVVENVSVVNNYRSQFNRVLNRGSFGELLKRLRQARVNQTQAKKPRPDTTIVSYWILAQASSPRPR
jgi:phospholipid transport system substrate-binding protein